MNFKGNLTAHLSVLGANLIYGANYTIAKLVMPAYIGPFGFILIRVVVTAIIFIVTGLFLRERKIDKEDYSRIFFCAFFGIAVNQLLFFKGLELTTPINAALMMTTNPIMVLIAAGILVNEKITLRKIAGIVIGIAGASSLLLYGNNISVSMSSIAGDGMVLINSLSFGIFLIMVKPLMKKYPTLLVMKWVFILGSAMVIPFGLSEFQMIQWETFDTAIWWSVVYVVIGVTTLAYVLNTYALKNLTPSSVSVYIYLQPLFATMFAMVTGSDHLRFMHFVAAVLIFMGVYLVTSTGTKDIKGKLLSLKKN